VWKQSQNLSLCLYHLTLGKGYGLCTEVEAKLLGSDIKLKLSLIVTNTSIPLICHRKKGQTIKKH